MCRESGLDLEEFLEIYGFLRVPGVWPGLRRISRKFTVFRMCRESGLDLEEFLENLRFSACAGSLAWTWKNFSKFTVFRVCQESGLDLEEFLEIYGFPRVPGVWPGLRRISRNLYVRQESAQPPHR